LNLRSEPLDKTPVDSLRLALAWFSLEVRPAFLKKPDCLHLEILFPLSRPSYTKHDNHFTAFGIATAPPVFDIGPSGAESMASSLPGWWAADCQSPSRQVK
jgi:hypothetical protein